MPSAGFKMTVFFGQKWGLYFTGESGSDSNIVKGLKTAKAVGSRNNYFLFILATRYQ